MDAELLLISSKAFRLIHFHFTSFTNVDRCIREPYAEQKDFQGVTHCFVDKRMHEISLADRTAMKRAGVHLVTVLYLSTCVNDKTLLPIDDYIAKF